MKLSKFWWISTITGAMLLCYLACNAQQGQMQPDSSITKNLQLFDFYPECVTDYEVETIAHHYMTGEDYPEAFGHILVDFDNYELPIYVWQTWDGYLYWYKVDPYTGAEHRVFLSTEQKKHVWSFN